MQKPSYIFESFSENMKLSGETLTLERQRIVIEENEFDCEKSRNK